MTGRISMLCLMLPLMAEGACRATLQVPASRVIPPWLSIELARGGSLQDSLDVRIAASSDCRLLLGAETRSPVLDRGRVSVRSGPNGAELGSAPGAGLPLLPLVLDANFDAVVTPLVEWSAEGRALRAGRHEARVVWYLYDAAGLLPEPLATLETVLSADVPALLEVNLAGEGGRLPLAGTSTMLNFGELFSDAERELEIEISGNAPAQLSLAQQWGELRLADRPDYRIPYTVLLDGRMLPAGAASQSVPLDGGSVRLRLSVQIGEVERRAAGVYGDVLTVQVAPE